MSHSSRIWDCVFLEGELFMHRTAVALLKIHRPLLIRADFEECASLLRHLPQVFVCDFHCSLALGLF